MANNQYVNKVIYGSTTLIDISDTTAVANKVLSGYYFYDKSGGFLGGVGVNSSKIPFFYDSKGISYNILYIMILYNLIILNSHPV